MFLGHDTKITCNTSGQDGGIGRHTVSPRTTKRRTTTNLKTKITGTAKKSNCMEVQQPRSQKRNIHPDWQEGWRQAAGVERTCSKETDQVDARWLLVVCAFPHMCVEKSEDTTRKRDRLHNPGFQHRQLKPQNLQLEKFVGTEVVGGTPSLTGKFVGEIHRVLEGAQAHPLGNQYQRGPI